MNIKKIKITNFKSIDSLTLENLMNFSVFAGANGSGKTNIFQSLEFVSSIMRQGLSSTLRKFGGYHNVHSHKRRSQNAKTFTFEIELDISDINYHYSLKAAISQSPNIISEVVKVQDKTILNRKEGTVTFTLNESDDSNKISHFDPDKTALMFLSITDKSSIYHLLQNIKVLRVDPIRAKEPSVSDHDPYEINEHASNIAAVMSRIQKENPNLTEDILELITLIVPNLQKIDAAPQKIDNKTGLLFKETGTKQRFPSHLISDGTIYALAQIIMILDRHPDSWLLIEEPERGIHPQAIQELTSLMREESSETLIWINTHSESVIRTTKPEELLLVDKNNGKTQITKAYKVENIPLSDAWLSNMFKGGLPW